MKKRLFVMGTVIAFVFCSALYARPTPVPLADLILDGNPIASPLPAQTVEENTYNIGEDVVLSFATESGMGYRAYFCNASRQELANNGVDFALQGDRGADQFDRMERICMLIYADIATGSQVDLGFGNMVLGDDVADLSDAEQTIMRNRYTASGMMTMPGKKSFHVIKGCVERDAQCSDFDQTLSQREKNAGSHYLDASYVDDQTIMIDGFDPDQYWSRVSLHLIDSDQNNMYMDYFVGGFDSGLSVFSPEPHHYQFYEHAPQVSFIAPSRLVSELNTDQSLTPSAVDAPVEPEVTDTRAYYSIPEDVQCVLVHRQQPY